MTFAKMIARLMTAASSADLNAPRFESMEERRMMAGHIAGVAVDPSAPSITDGTSNTILYAERKAGGTQQQYLQVKLEDALISSYS